MRLIRRHGVVVLLLLVSVGLSYKVRDLSAAAADDGRGGQNMIKLAIWLLIAIPCALHWQRIVAYARDPAIGWFAAYALAAVLSAAWSIVPAMTAVSAAGLLLYLGFACLVADSVEERLILRTLIFGLSAYAAACWLTVVVRPDIAFNGVGDYSSTRLQGLSGHPNVLAEQMGVLLCLLLISRVHLRTGLFGALLVLSIGTLLATGSRTWMAAILLAVTAYQLRGLFWLGFMGLLSVYLLSQLLDVSLGDAIARAGSDPLTGRGEIWDYATQKIAHSPLIGYGFNSFDAVSAIDNNVHQGDLGLKEPPPPHPHNMMLAVAFSGGLLTLIPFVAWLGVLLRRWRKMPSRVDLIVLLVLFGGATEASIAGSPYLTTLVLFLLLALEQRNREGSIR